MYDIHKIARSGILDRLASGLHQMPMPEICVRRYAETRRYEVADAHSGKAIYYESESQPIHSQVALAFQDKIPWSELADCTLIADIKKIESNKTTDPTIVQALVNARVGQGKFGLQVRQLWDYRCSVTGSCTKAALEASHIQAWADSSDAQRLDPNNGLLLTANLHKLFDAGLISFEDSGKMVVSSKLSTSEQEIFGVIGRRLSKKPSAETVKYLASHRAKFAE